MSGEVTKADLQTMTTAGEKVREKYTDITGQVANIDDKVELLRAKWQGPAATKFQELMADWKVEATKLTNALDAIGVKLKEVSQRRNARLEEEQTMVARVAAESKFGVLNN